MKKMKIVALVVALALTGVMTVSAAPKSTKPVEIKFWSLFTGGDGEFFDAMVAEFNKQHKDIKAVADTVKYSDYYTRLTAALAAKNAPDVVICHQGNLVNYVPNGVVTPLDALLSSAKAPMGDFLEAPLKGCMYNGKTYAIPLDVHPIIMYVNKDLLAKAGITKVPQTLDEILAAAKAVQSKVPDTIGIAADNTTATYHAETLTRLFISMLGQQGASLFAKDMKSVNFDNAAGVKALQTLNDFVNGSKVTPSGLDYDSSVNAFKNGEAAIHFNGVWATGAFESTKGLNFVAVPLPGLLGNPACWTNSHTMILPVQKSVDPAKQAAAVEFMMWMTAHGDMWAKAGHIPTRKSVQASDSFIKMPYRKGYADAAANVIAIPPTAAYSEVYAKVTDALEEAIAKNKDAKTAIPEIAKMANAIIAKY
jgi:multiple sugar transport system substrate-binding protein